MSYTTNILWTKEKQTYHVTCDFLNQSNLVFCCSTHTAPL